MIDLVIKAEDKRVKFLEEIRSLNAETLYIWGGGSYSKNVIDYLRTVGKYNGRIQQVVDDEYYTAEQTDVMPLSSILNGKEINAPIVFGFYDYSAILEKKLKHVFHYLYDFHLTIVNGQRLQWDVTRTKEHEAEYRKTYELLSDERSQRVMQLYLNAAVNGEFQELFTECHEEPAYFNRITQGLQVETLIDCGAYNGDSIHDFVCVFPEYERIIAFEPDPENLTALRHREQEENIHDLTIMNKGVGSQNKVLHFRANGRSNSFFDQEGDLEIQITSLDEISSLVTGNAFIKMDIEGSELDALRGAEKLICEKHPVLAICVYHKENDLIEIPNFIHKTAGEGVYNYYLGFHGLDLAELVFYAIPKELE